MDYDHSFDKDTGLYQVFHKKSQSIAIALCNSVSDAEKVAKALDAQDNPAEESVPDPEPEEEEKAEENNIVDPDDLFRRH